jgi:hypothetical protein
MMEMKKILVVGIIFLFIGVAIAPSINLSIVKASQDDDLVEVTTQACGIQGYGNTTVKLTKEHYQNLEQYLVEFRVRLNQTSTREEAIPIFKEAVVELNKYGLLPRGMSVEKAQRLVLGKSTKKEIHIPKQISCLSEPSYNFFCYVSGNVTEGPFSTLLATSLLVILDILSGGGLRPFFALLTIVILLIDMPFCNVLPIPFSIFQCMMPLNFYNSRCYGNIQTVGLLGNKKYEGNLYGCLGPLGSGIVGFTGIKIHNGEKLYDYYFIGTALAVGMSVQRNTNEDD